MSMRRTFIAVVVFSGTAFLSQCVQSKVQFHRNYMHLNTNFMRHEFVNAGDLPDCCMLCHAQRDCTTFDFDVETITCTHYFAKNCSVDELPPEDTKIYVESAFPVSFSPEPVKQNVALYKPATQSSVQFYGCASLAVDGYSNPDYLHGSCSHTRTERDPWWQVDLETVLVIRNVTITNRLWLGERLHDFYIKVSNSSNTAASCETCTFHQGVFGTGGLTRTIVCDEPVHGRYLTIQIESTYDDVLTLCEVVVN